MHTYSKKPQASTSRAIVEFKWYKIITDKKDICYGVNAGACEEQNARLDAR
jgi:arginine repressor